MHLFSSLAGDIYVDKAVDKPVGKTGEITQTIPRSSIAAVRALARGKVPSVP